MEERADEMSWTEDVALLRLNSFYALKTNLSIWPMKRTTLRETKETSMDSVN